MCHFSGHRAFPKFSVVLCILTSGCLNSFSKSRLSFGATLPREEERLRHY